MEIIAIEEHATTPALRKLLEKGPANEMLAAITPRLADLGEGRLKAMDEAGITMQVLSIAALGLESLAAEEREALFRDANDLLAGAVRQHPTRFSAFATLALDHPEAAATEFERCVRQLGFVGALVDGTVNGRFLDAPEFEPLFATAEALDVPIYLHPAPPPPGVMQAYFSDLPPGVGPLLARAGWGWHVETGLHVLRLIVSGLFDRHPRLRLIVGHMGENLPFSLVRADTVLGRVTRHLERGVSETFLEHFWITTSGYFSHPPFLCALQVVGAARILFSVDYPFSENKVARSFLDSLAVSPADRERIASGNARQILRLATR